jgi:hypothetical protein
MRLQGRGAQSSKRRSEGVNFPGVNLHFHLRLNPISIPSNHQLSMLLFKISGTAAK